MPIFKATADNILSASRIVRQGGLVVYPTDTVYGLGCDPFNINAVKRLLDVKARGSKPLPILASSIDQVERIAFVSRGAKRIVEMFWPGPLTLLVPKKPILPQEVTGDQPSVGVRIPNHGVAFQLIDLSDGLLVGTSANKRGERPARTAQEAAEGLEEDVEMILDDGPATLGAPSTVVDLTSRKPRIMREGFISLKEISRVFFR